jgi:hypothetical protein
MACIGEDGALTPTGVLMLKGLRYGPLPPEDIAKQVSEPIFRVRGSLRELAGADLIEERDGLYHLTDAGREKVNL